MRMRTARFGNFRFGATRFNNECIIHRIHINALYDFETADDDAEYELRHPEAAAVYDLEHDRLSRSPLVVHTQYCRLNVVNAGDLYNPKYRSERDLLSTFQYRANQGIVQS